MRLFVPFIAVFVMACGGPKLEPKVATSHTFVSPVKCTQGPFEIHMKTLGAKWGESVVVKVHSPRRITGRWNADIGGRKEDGNYDSTHFGSQAENSACVLTDAERAQAIGSGTSAPRGTPVGTPVPSKAGDPGGAPPTSTITLREVPATEVKGSGEWTYVVELRFPRETLDAPSITAGLDISLILWSVEPNDFGGAFITFEQEAYTPSVSDAEWTAHLEKKKAQAKADADSNQKEREAQRKDNEKARLEADAQRKKEEQERIEYCASHAAECALDAKIEADAQARAAQIAAKEKYRATKSRELDDKQREERTRVAEFCNTHAGHIWCKDRGWSWEGGAANGVAIAPPSKPPPAPRAEIAPPQPSEHAEWIPGYWYWTGGEYVWLSGGWRVPEIDRAEKRTATAPSMPPVQKVEVRPTAPAKVTVWTQGYWAWNGNTWVWISGAWKLPPSREASWRPTVWVQEGVRVRLDPGGWIFGK